MEHVEIIPLVGIRFSDKIIVLSALREDVQNILGSPSGMWGTSWFYFNNGLRFDFDKNGKVEFIEFLAGINGNIQPQIYGIYAFQVEADVLYDILTQKNDGDIGDNENGHAYAFLNISVGVFRDRTPESVQEMIEEAEEDGEPMETDDIEYETRKANHWATIGIGIKNYYS